MSHKTPHAPRFMSSKQQLSIWVPYVCIKGYDQRHPGFACIVICCTQINHDTHASVTIAHMDAKYVSNEGMQGDECTISLLSLMHEACVQAKVIETHLAAGKSNVFGLSPIHMKSGSLVCLPN